MMLLMKKVYTAFAAAMIATASFAQPLAHPTTQGPFANNILKYQPRISQNSGKILDFMRPNTASNTLNPMFKARAKKAASESELITKQPEGTLHANLYGEGVGYLVFWGYVISSAIDGNTENYVEGPNGEVYLQNALGTIGQGNWIKGEKAEGDTIQFKFPQVYYAQDGTDDDGNPTGETEYYYLYRSVLTTTDEGKTLAPDETSQTIKYVLRNDSLIRVDNYDKDVYLALCTEDGDWTGYADFYQTWTKMKEAAPVPPASATASDYQISFVNEDGQDDATITKVAIDGSDIYIGGLNESAPDTWAKGKIEGDKVVFSGKSYMGVDKVNSAHTFFSALGSKKVYYEGFDDYIDSVYFEKSISFDYDATAKTLKSDGMFGVNFGRNDVYTLATYTQPQFKPWKEIPGKPADPELLQFMAYDDDEGYGGLQFWFEKISADGNLLNTDKLFYNVYFDDDLFTVEPDEYPKVNEEMTDIPYKYTENYDITMSGGTHTFFFYTTGFSKLGLQTLYKDGDNVYKSNLVEYDIDEDGNFTPVTGISKTEISTGSNDVKSVRFTDLSGRSVSKLTDGVYLKTMTMGDGSQKTVKVVKK